MVFSSVVFLFAFLPVALASYFALFVPYARTRQPFWLRASNAALLFVSVLFYAWGEASMVFVLVGLTLLAYVCGRFVAPSHDLQAAAAAPATASTTARNVGPGFFEAAGASPGRRTISTRAKIVVGIAIVVHLVVLLSFKYAMLIGDSVGSVLQVFGVSNAQARAGTRAVVPLGVSFYALQTLSYVIDVYRGTVRPSRQLLEFACYVSMFPQLVAGPIVRYRDIERELRTRSVPTDQFGEGATRVIVGLAKKLLIADTLAQLTDQVFNIPAEQLSAGIAWLGAFSGAVQIYFDFSAYSDIAIGLGRMLGFHFRENFDYPYAARSITDFWRRWHISLSTWFRD